MLTSSRSHSSVAPFHLGLPGLIIRFLVLYLQNFGMLGVISLAAVGTVGYIVCQTLRDQLVTHGAPTAQLSVQDLPRVEHGEKWKNWQPDRKNK